ncbi:Type I restriction modification DNA specificity domain-containing protein [Tenacibaculum dicentrarchi]|nr:Type I restriction modification DNA specificity domain-containing protein [Tenacibaculum dicentrarchi]
MYKDILTTKLGDITEVQFGLYQKKEMKGDVKYLTSSHFDKYLNPTLFKNSFVEFKDKDSKFLLKPNDVILAGKGQRIFAWAYEESFGAVMPSSLFYIIRTDATKVNGHYLASILNSSQKQYELTLLGSGSSIISITKKELLDLEIPLPTLEAQNKIVNIEKLLDKEISIVNQILEKKRALKKGILNQLLTNKSKR